MELMAYCECVTMVMGHWWVWPGEMGHFGQQDVLRMCDRNGTLVGVAAFGRLRAAGCAVNV